MYLGLTQGQAFPVKISTMARCVIWYFYLHFHLRSLAFQIPEENLQIQLKITKTKIIFFSDKDALTFEKKALKSYLYKYNRNPYRVTKIAIKKLSNFRCDNNGVAIV